MPVFSTTRATTTHTRASLPLQAAIAQLGERQTEDLKVPGSIPGLGIRFSDALLASRISSLNKLLRVTLFQNPL